MLATASTGIDVLGNKVINFGSDQTKATAGSIGYQIMTSCALDVYGGGTVMGSRIVKVWDNLAVAGTVDVAGSARVNAECTLGGNLSIRAYTLRLTVPAVNTTQVFALPAGVTSANCLSLTGVTYNANSLTYPVEVFVQDGG